MYCFWSSSRLLMMIKLLRPCWSSLTGISRYNAGLRTWTISNISVHVRDSETQVCQTRQPSQVRNKIPHFNTCVGALLNRAPGVSGVDGDPRCLPCPAPHLNNPQLPSLHLPLQAPPRTRKCLPAPPPTPTLHCDPRAGPPTLTNEGTRRQGRVWYRCDCPIEPPAGDVSPSPGPGALPFPEPRRGYGVQALQGCRVPGPRIGVRGTGVVGVPPVQG